MGPFVELQCRQAVLSVDDEKLFLRLLQPADAAAVAPLLEAQLLGREEQDRSRNGRLRDGRFVEIADGPDFGTGQFPLEGFFAPLDAGDKLRHVITLLDLFGLNCPALLIVEPADEPHAGQQSFRRIRREVEHGIFLANLRGDHGGTFRLLILRWATRAFLLATPGGRERQAST